MDILQYSKNEQSFKNILAECQILFSGDDLSKVRHYLNHGELGMALEGLILELLRKDGILPEGLGRR
jgi:hypothetical protein